MAPALAASRFVVIIIGDRIQTNYIINYKGASHLSRPVCLCLTDDPEALGRLGDLSKVTG